jgi:hypothetical protein
VSHPKGGAGHLATFGWPTSFGPPLSKGGAYHSNPFSFFFF